MSRVPAGVAGLLTAAVALASTELAAGVLPGRRSPIIAVGDAVIERTPGTIVRSAIEVFGNSSRLVLLLSMAVVMVLAGVLIGLAGARWRGVGVAGLGMFGVLGVSAGFADPLIPSVSAVLAPAIGMAVGTATLLRLLRTATASEPDLHRAHPINGPTATAKPYDVADPKAHGRPTGDIDNQTATRRTQYPPPARSRREFLVAGTVAAGAAAVLAVIGRTLQGRAASGAAPLASRLPTPRVRVEPPPPSAQFQVPGISPLITPNIDFYRIDTALAIPRIDPSLHSIRVTGMVDRPFELNYDELLDLVDTEAYVTLACVSNQVGGGLVGNARWLGVRLRNLLDRAGVQSNATQVVGRAVDGWTAGFPVDAAFDGRSALVAVGMNGEPLPPKHGFPVRLVVSGLYGYVSDTKWLSAIELTTFDAFDAYWIPRGWAKQAPIKTQSRIDVPRMGSTFATGDIVVAGVAWSDERGVTAVEVSVDDGPWQLAELGNELAATSWRQWRFTWDATSSGTHLLRVRAFDADGIPQTSEVAPPFPDGATGYHASIVRVV